MKNVTKDKNGFVPRLQSIVQKTSHKEASLALTYDDADVGKGLVRALQVPAGRQVSTWRGIHQHESDHVNIFCQQF